VLVDALRAASPSGSLCASYAAGALYGCRRTQSFSTKRGHSAAEQDFLDRFGPVKQCWSDRSTSLGLGGAMDVADWLHQLGLGEYEAAFRENSVTAELLPNLTPDDLKDLGIALVGHRRRLLDAISALRADADRAGNPQAASAEHPRPSQQSTAERRQLSVMFCDLIASTPLSSRLDPEDLSAVIRGYQARVAAIIARSRGFIARYVGDGILIYFGWPEAHEANAESAVRAALAVIDAIAQAPVLTEPLQVRIGIATGLVVVGEPIGTGEARQQTAIGETPNLAARLQNLAGPNGIVIDAATRQQIGSFFKFRDLGQIVLKGFPHPVPAWEVVEEAAVESRFEALRAETMTPLVGRQEELDLLRRRWLRAVSGEGQVVLLSGEPGIGKSRLVQTLLERIAGEPHTRVRCFCSPHHQESALYPSIAQLERAAGFRRDDTPEQRLDKLELLLAQATDRPDDAAPLIADLLSIQSGERYPPLELTPQMRKEKTLRVLLARLEGLAAHEPMLMLYEDAHWSDPTSTELLDLIVARTVSLRLLLIVTFRPEFTAPWIGRPHVSLLSLNRLPRRERGAIIAGVTGGKSLPQEVAEQIIDRTDGVPLFVEELTKAVIESGMLTDLGDRYVAKGPLPSLAIPATLHGSLLARLDRMAPVREVAQIGAALGRQFSHDLISAVATMPQSQVDGALAQLVSAELVYRRGVPPDAEYTFKHALVQDAAYQSMLKSRRVVLHARIADVLERSLPEPVEPEAELEMQARLRIATVREKHFSTSHRTQPELLAFHYEQAGDLERSMHYWITAGNVSEQQGASLEAIAQYRAAEQLIRSDAPSAMRLCEPVIGIKLGNALMQAEGYNSEAGRQAFERARLAADKLDLPEEYAKAGIGVSPLLFGQCRYSEVIAIGEGISSKLSERLRPQTSVHLWTMLGVAHYCIGEFQAAIEYETRAIELDSEIHCTHENPIGGGDPAVVSRSYAVISSLALGWLEKSRTRSEEAWTIARAGGHAFSIAWAGLIRLRSLFYLGRYAESIETANVSIAICERHGFNARMGNSLVYRGLARFAMGERREGLADARNGLTLWRRTSGSFHGSMYISEFVHCLLQDGSTDEADLSLRDAEEIVGRTEERSHFPEIRRLRGRLLELRGERRKAVDHYQQALEWSRERQAKLFELRAATSLARVRRDEGRRSEARDLLAPVYGWYTEGFDAPDLKEAKALLSDLR